MVIRRGDDCPHGNDGKGFHPVGRRHLAFGNLVPGGAMTAFKGWEATPAGAMTALMGMMA